MVTFSCGAWEAVLFEECGSNLCSLKYRGEELLRAPERLEALQGRPCLYGFPLLFPTNRTEDGAFSFEGESYQLAINEQVWNNHIHGLIKDAPFRVLEKGETYVKTVLENEGEYYPFPFTVYLEDALSETGWLRRITLQNTGTQTMPYTMGFHTTFREPEFFQVPICERYEMNERYIPTGKLLPLNDWQLMCRDGFTPDGSKINGSYTSRGNTVRVGDFVMTVSEQFDHWVLFNGSGVEGFLCIEPQCGAVNGLNNGKHRTLKPGQKEIFTVSIGM